MTMNTAPVKKHTLSYMEKSQGDFRVEWDPEEQAEIDAARLTFDKLKNQGYSFFSMSPGGKKGSQITSFDHSAKSILAVPQTMGG